MLNRNQHILSTMSLGQEHTYGELKADSDSLAAAIDQLGLPEKSPVVVLVVRNMRCWLPLWR